MLSILPPLVPRPPNLTLSFLEVSAKMQTRSVVRFPVQPCACARTVLNPFYRGANGGLGVVTRPRFHRCNRQTLSLSPFTMPGADSVPDYRAREALSLPSNRSQPCVTVPRVWSPESWRWVGARSRPARLPNSHQAGRGWREGSFGYVHRGPAGLSGSEEIPGSREGSAWSSLPLPYQVSILVRREARRTRMETCG